jgi:hypothetical protein
VWLPYQTPPTVLSIIELILFEKSRIIGNRNLKPKGGLAPMTEYELLTLIHGGENIRVEFKKSTNEITRDVYDTVCSFSNRDGGIIILGVKDNGEILGIIPDAVDRMKKILLPLSTTGRKSILPFIYSRKLTR